jgi:hypothetical protein
MKIEDMRREDKLELIIGDAKPIISGEVLESLVPTEHKENYAKFIDAKYSDDGYDESGYSDHDFNDDHN